MYSLLFFLLVVLCIGWLYALYSSTPSPSPEYGDGAAEIKVAITGLENDTRIEYYPKNGGKKQLILNEGESERVTIGTWWWFFYGQATDYITVKSGKAQFKTENKVYFRDAKNANKQISKKKKYIGDSWFWIKV